MMDLYALALLVSLLAHTFILSMVLGNWRQNRGNLLFLLTIFCVLGWTAAEFFTYYYPLSEDQRLFVFRSAAFCWGPITVLFYAFVCHLLGRPTGGILIFYVMLCLVGSGIYAFSDLGIRSIYVTETAKGYISGPLHATLVLGTPGLAGVHSLTLLFLASRKTRSSHEKFTYLSLAVGAGCALSASTGINVVIPELLGFANFPRVGTATVLLYAISVYIAMTRHQFMSISLSQVAEELFDDVRDGIILMDSSNLIKRINPAATEMLRVSTEQAKGMTLQALLEERVAVNRPAPHEISVETAGEARHFSLAQSETTRHGETIGRIVLLSEITKHKRIEQMLTTARDELEKEVQKRLNELGDAKAEIIQQAHQSELAAITTGTLHNVMNMLNTVKIAAEVLDRNLSDKRLSRLNSANEILREQYADIEAFITRDPRGKKLLTYYLRFEEVLGQIVGESRERIDKIREMVAAIEVIVAAQQKYGGAASAEEISLPQLIEDAITMQAGNIESYGVNIIKQFSSTPRIRIEKSKLIHVLINLIKNAKEAMTDIPEEHRTLTFRTGTTDEHIFVQVSDTGCGISAENLSKMFSYGFTTKQDGHGFGLHTCRAYMVEMGGELTVISGGEMSGTTFTLELPIRRDTVHPEARA